MRLALALLVLIVVSCAPPAAVPSPGTSATSSGSASATTSASPGATQTAQTSATAPASASTSPGGTPVSVPCPAGLVAINGALRFSGSDVLRPGFRVCAPTRYFATSGEMMTPYLTQGGTGGPPELFLTVDSQPLHATDEWRDVFRSQTDCVALFWTRGFNIDQFRAAVFDSVGLDSKPVAAPATARAGRLEVLRQDVTAGNRQRSTAYIRVGDGAFYFSNCDVRNTLDLNTVIAGFEVRER